MEVASTISSYAVIPAKVVATYPTLEMIEPKRAKVALRFDTIENKSVVSEKRLNQNVNSFADAANGRGANNTEHAENVAHRFYKSRQRTK